jgi:hypothetical protein
MVRFAFPDYEIDFSFVILGSGILLYEFLPFETSSVPPVPRVIRLRRFPKISIEARNNPARMHTISNCSIDTVIVLLFIYFFQKDTMRFHRLAVASTALLAVGVFSGHQGEEKHVIPCQLGSKSVLFGIFSFRDLE